jgi:hypothetical protein
MTGDCIQLHNEALQDLWLSPDNIRLIRSRMKWVGHVARLGENRNAYRVLMEKPECKRPHGRPKYRWKNNKRNRKNWEERAWNGLI